MPDGSSAATMGDVVAAIGLIGALSAGSAALLADLPATQWGEFNRRIDGYLAVRRHVEQAVAGPRASSDRQEVLKASDELAGAIQSARATARQGDIFSPAIAADYRRQIRTILIREGGHAADLLTDLTLDLWRPQVQPIVNGRFDWELDAVMPPALIEGLPPLPGELQYRFVGRDLILIDIVAGLVVDILPRALPLFHRQLPFVGLTACCER